MAKSKETFSKKENEKKRVQKKKEKEARKEERKANSVSGKSLDDMMAYVDENGNLADTPPDPKKIFTINAEDIEIGVKKMVEVSGVRTGIVTHFNDQKGYGFIKDKTTQESIFVHINALTEPLKENNKVSFETEMGQKGLVAVNVKVLR